MLDTTRGFPGTPPRRERIFNVPPAIIVVIAALALVHAVRLVVSDEWDNQILLRLAFVPGTFTYGVDPDAILDALRTLVEQGDRGLREAEVGHYILANAGFQPWTALTYGLLHANWTHVGLNSLWLLAFGSPVARRLGSRRFLAFLGVATVAGALAHYAAHPVGLMPVIGASAAVSGCMGAALRFMFQPQAPVWAIVGLGEQGREEALHRPLRSLPALLRDRRVVAFLAVWFLTNALFGFGVAALGSADAPIAWEAHMGGFLLGLLALPWFDRATRRPAGRDPPSDLPPTDLAGGMP